MNANSAHSNTAKRWILISLMCTMMLAAMDTTIVSTAIPQIVGELGDFEKFSWVFSIYLLAQTITIPVYEKLADLYSRKPILLVGSSLFLLSSLACGFSWDMSSLITFRGIQGLGAGSIMATVNTLAGDLYSVKERGKVQDWFSSVWGMAAIIGPTLGGAFAEYISWRWIFLINLPIGIVAIFLLIKFLHEIPPKGKPNIDYLGACCMLISGTLFIYTLNEGGHSWEWLSLKGLFLEICTLFMIGITLYVEKNLKNLSYPLGCGNIKLPFIAT
ncbi:MFS transporter [Elizabethkingia sp. JS20170427COW]|uniref:MFS transporter n=1 Tax=Elizabethkingia sp. JS20170427COW TaxID=2583851 RepID=UPI001C88BC7C|nr:MFS transporter [Elizabethkingia sp. JS20170427COW]